MRQLHQQQLKILDGLLFSLSAKYSELKPILMENSQFVFHLERLIKMGLIKKGRAGYQLTTAGKEYANRIYVRDLKIIRQVKSTTVICACKEKNHQRFFLVYQRLKHPFFGCWGFPTEKPRWGEKLITAVARGLKEEASLRGEGKLFAIRHYRVYSKKDKLLEDKLMHAFLFRNPQGKLKGSIEGNYCWVKEKDLIKKVKPPLEEFREFYQALKDFKNKISFKEIDVKTKRF
ncbi:MAG: NUDIX hydrolase [Candidatus Pacebacteria bacterium]|nr:NUDIX hydrolase [Candidatus Paceibacterota bacterium]